MKLYRVKTVNEIAKTLNSNSRGKIGIYFNYGLMSGWCGTIVDKNELVVRSYGGGGYYYRGCSWEHDWIVPLEFDNRLLEELT